MQTLMATGALGLTVLTDLENTSTLLDEHNDLEAKITHLNMKEDFFFKFAKTKTKKTPRPIRL